MPCQQVNAWIARFYAATCSMRSRLFYAAFHCFHCFTLSFTARMTTLPYSSNNFASKFKNYILLYTKICINFVNISVFLYFVFLNFVFLKFCVSYLSLFLSMACMVCLFISCFGYEFAVITHWHKSVLIPTWLFQDRNESFSISPINLLAWRSPFSRHMNLSLCAHENFISKW